MSRDDWSDATSELAAAAADEFLARLEAGEAPDIDAFLESHPEAAESLRQAIPALLALRADSPEEAATAEDGPCAREPMGDFRLVREIGRGGMGVVYEAEQLSLGRRVALKILPLAGMLDERQIRRFQNEARAAAQLHHPNILPIYSVGCERGVHYYAMQLVNGPTLADVIAHLRVRDGGSEPDELGRRVEPSARTGEDTLGAHHGGSDPSATGSGAVPDAQLSCPRVCARSGLRDEATRGSRISLDAGEPTRFSGSSAADRIRERVGACAVFKDSLGESTRSPAFFRAVAQLGIQAAEALQHAHEEGIIHRDIKPSNLLLDERGKLWIADFGLARVEHDPGITMTGDLLGTLRYMSPEQAQGQRGAVDARSDIYLLGVTLYELLTLRPAIPGKDRRQVLRRIMDERIESPRQINPAIPRDLETIILKAAAGERASRYASARELSDDLRRYLEHKPVRARRPNFRERGAKWVRRHSALTVSAMVVLLVISIAALISNSLLAAARTRAEHLAADQAEAAEEARRQKERAESSERLASRRSEQLRSTLYANSLSMAQVAFRDGAVARGRELLAACPVKLRAWEWQYLLSQQEDESQRTIRAHEAGISNVALSPDESKLISSCDDQTLKVWSWPAGKLLLTLRGHGAAVSYGQFTPDGSRIVSGGRDGKLKIWDATTGLEQASLDGNSDQINWLACSPNGRYAATTHTNGNLVGWELDTGRQVFKQKLHTAELCGVVFSPDGGRIAAAAGPKAVVCDASTGQVRQTFAEDMGDVLLVAFAPDGQQMVSTSKWGVVRYWDLSSGKALSSVRSASMAGGLAFTPDGKQLISGHQDGTVTIRETATGGERILRGHRGLIWGITFSSRNQEIITGATDGAIKVWRADSPGGVRIARGHTSKISGIAFSPDGTRFATAGDDKTVRVWETRTGKQVLQLAGHSSMAVSVQFSLDGRKLFSGGCDTVVNAWDLSTGALLNTFQCESVPWLFSRNGRVAVTHRGGIWDTATGTKRQVLQGHEGVAIAYAFTSDESRLAMGYGDGRVKIWDLDTGTQTHLLERHQGSIACVVFSADDTHLISAGRDRTLRMWDLATGSYTRIPVERSPVRTMALSPDGRRLVCGTDDAVLSIWDPELGEELLSLKGHNWNIVSLAVSPDGSAIASTSADGEIRIWEAQKAAKESLGIESICLGIRAAIRLAGSGYHEEAASQVQDLMASAETVTGAHAAHLHKVLAQIADRLRSGALAEADALLLEIRSTRSLVDEARALQGAFEDAIILYERAIAAARRSPEPDHEALTHARNGLGFILSVVGQPSKAEPLLREAVDGYEQLLGPLHENALGSLHHLADALAAQGRLPEAEQVFRDVLQRKRRVWGDHAGKTVMDLSRLCEILLLQDKHREAEPLIQELVDYDMNRLNSDEDYFRSSLLRLGQALVKRGQHSRGELLIHKAQTGKNVPLATQHMED